MRFDPSSVRGSLSRRAAAKFLDVLLLAFSAYLPVLLLAAAALVFGYDPFADGMGRNASILATVWLLVAAIGVVAAVAVEAAALTSRGRTMGMSVMSLRVVSVSDNPTLTLEQAVIRAALPAVAAGIGALSGVLMGVFGPVDAFDERGAVKVVAAASVSWLMLHLSAAVRADRRGWLDMAAGTAVVQDRPHSWRHAHDEVNQRWQSFLHGHKN